MEIAYLKDSSLKIKTKTGGVVVAPKQLSLMHKNADLPDFTVDGAGEYEVEGISVFGYQSGDQVVYVVQADDLRLLYLGALKSELDEKTIGELENIDVVIVDTDAEVGNKVLTDLVVKLEPYYVIPLGSGRESFIANYEHGSRTVKSLSLNRLSLNDEVTEVIVFE